MQSFKLVQPVIGLDIGSRSVKMVQLKDAVGGIQLLNFKLVELELVHKKEENAQELREATIKAIRESLRDFDTKLVKVISVVAGPRVSVRRVIMPPMPKREMVDAIKWEAKSHIPFPVEDAVIDFQVVGDVVEKGVKKYEVVVVAAEKTLIDEHMALLKSAGIRATSITAAPLCLWNLVRKGLTLPENKVVALLNVGGEVTDINIFKNGSLQFTRQVLIAGMSISRAMTGILVSDFGQVELDIHQAEEVKRKLGIPGDAEPQMIDDKISSTQILALIRPIVDRLISEIKRSFDYYREESRGQRVDKIILVGGSSQLKGFQELLAKGLMLEVEVGEPLANIQFKPDSPELAMSGSRLAVVMGGALGGTKGINLIPLSIRTAGRKFLQRLSVDVLFTVVLFLMLFDFLFVAAQVSNYRKRIASSEIELNTLRAEVKRASDLEELRANIAKRNSLIKELTDRGFDWVNILKELGNLVPANVILSSISLEKSEQVPVEASQPSGRSGTEGQQAQETEVPVLLKVSGKIIPSTSLGALRSTAALARFTANLEVSDYFADVNLISATKDEGKGMIFEVTCEIEK
ncbi:MAG: type IV pilus assembly protein PilM [bacterium]